MFYQAASFVAFALLSQICHCFTTQTISVRRNAFSEDTAVIAWYLKAETF